jgi:hypothetical protein
MDISSRLTHLEEYYYKWSIFELNNELNFLKTCIHNSNSEHRPQWHHRWCVLSRLISIDEHSSHQNDNFS